MVAGQVAAPKLELANEDLLRSHIHAIWLQESGMSLGRCLTEILDVRGENPSLVIVESKQAALDDSKPKERAKNRATLPGIPTAGWRKSFAIFRWPFNRQPSAGKHFTVPPFSKPKLTERSSRLAMPPRKSGNARRVCVLKR